MGRKGAAKIVITPNAEPESAIAPASHQERFERWVADLVAQLVLQQPGSELEPSFRTKALTDSIRKLQPVPRQRVWARYVSKWGCLSCRKKAAPYAAGFCARCYLRVWRRLQAIERQLARERPDAKPETDKLLRRVRDAQRALRSVNHVEEER